MHSRVPTPAGTVVVAGGTTVTTGVVVVVVVVAGTVAVTALAVICRPKKFSQLPCAKQTVKVLNPAGRARAAVAANGIPGFHILVVNAALA